MRKSKSIAVLAVVWLAATVLPAGGVVRGEPTEDEQWPNPSAAVAGLHTFLIEETPQTAGSESSVSVLMSEPLSGGTFLCSSLSDVKCTQPEGYHYRAVLQPCDATVTIDCIESVSSISGGAESKGTFSRMYPKKGVNSFDGSVEDKVPNGTTPSIWNLTKAPHAFGSEYLVMVSISGDKRPNGSPPRSFTAQIIPVSEFQTSCQPKTNGHCIDTYEQAVDEKTGLARLQFDGVAEDYGKYRCAMYGDDSKCALRHAFPAGVSYSLSVRLATEPRGWLHGRINNASASITTTAGVTTIKVTADPVKVPSIGAATMWSDLSLDLQAWFDAQCAAGNCGTRDSGMLNKPGPERNAGIGPYLYDPKAFEYLTVWKNQLKDKAAAIPSAWSVRTLSNSEMNGTNSCISKASGVSGIVSTNATLYSQGPPSFDAATGTLQYKVATTHYQTDGVTPFKGSYEMIMRSDIARCIYGFTSAPIQATVEVVEENGTTGTATTSVSEADGWLKLSAAGFTFSAPTVRAKLTQSATVASGSPTASTNSSLKAKSVLSGAALARKSGLAVPRGAKVTVAVARSARAYCQAVGVSVRGLKKGTCKVTVTVTLGKKKTSKSVSLSVL